MDDILKIKEWLHLTNQQYAMIRCISILVKENASKPKDIEKQYAEFTGKRIQKTNLFGILKILMDEELIFKDEKENYRLNIQFIKERLELEKRKLIDEESKIQDFLSDPNSLLSKLDDKAKNEIFVSLINKKQFYEKLIVKIESCEDYFNISRFPSIFFTETISKRINRDKYIESMENGLRNNDLKIAYLTNLDVSRVYNHTLSIFKDKKSAKKEVELVIERFSELVKKFSSLHIYFSEKKPDWEFIILSNKYSKEIFLILRSKDNEESPGILHVISTDVAEKAFKIMDKRIETAEKINERNISKFITRMRSNLKKL